MEEKTFKSTYLLRVLKGEYNPFTGNTLFVSEEFIEHSKRNWHLISKDTNTFHFQNVIGINVDKHLIGASLKIMTVGKESIYICGFSKKKANAIKSMCSKYISKNTQRSTTEALSNAITSAVGNSHNAAPSRIDELKGLKDLLEQGVLTQEEFTEQKNRILNS